MHKAQNLLKFIASASQYKSPPAVDLEQNNTIFNQQKRIILNKVDLEKVQIALVQIDEAKKHLIGEMAALQGFDGISKRDLLIAANMAHGYDYMLQEFLHQSRGGLKTENFNYGLVKL